MAIQFACPHCHHAMPILEDSGGQTARCPACMIEFLIPGDGPAATAPIATQSSLLAGSVTVSDVERAHLAAQQLAADHLAAHVQWVEAKRRHQRLTTAVRTVRLLTSGRRWLDQSAGRIGGLWIAITLGAGVFVVLMSAFSLTVSGYAIAALVGALLAGVAYLPFSFLPSDEALAEASQRLVLKFGEVSNEYNGLESKVVALHSQAAAAQAEYQQLKAAIEGRLHWLRTCQWQRMTGSSFETFLAEVFKERGYTVEATGKGGDQGVDLIVTRGGSRVAVQAKGYVGHTVGNGAVQEAHAGKGFYRCHSAAVITNSAYTAAARELAERLDCKLVDGSQIPDLIEGRILL